MDVVSEEVRRDLVEAIFAVELDWAHFNKKSKTPLIATMRHVGTAVWDVMDKYSMRQYESFHSGFDALRKVAAKDSSAGNNRDEQFVIGWMYHHGMGMPSDILRAKGWYILSANQGHLIALNNVGWMYDNGIGAPTDDARALTYFLPAAEGGIDVAQYNLARLYRNGEGVPVDLHKALHWFSMAEQQGHPTAASCLADLHRFNWQELGIDEWIANRKAAEFERRAILLGEPNSWRLSKMYSKGVGVPVDSARAKAWEKKSRHMVEFDEDELL